MDLNSGIDFGPFTQRPLDPPSRPHKNIDSSIPFQWISMVESILDCTLKAQKVVSFSMDLNGGIDFGLFTRRPLDLPPPRPHQKIDSSIPIQWTSMVESILDFTLKAQKIDSFSIEFNSGIDFFRGVGGSPEVFESKVQNRFHHSNPLQRNQFCAPSK